MPGLLDCHRRTGAILRGAFGDLVSEALDEPAYFVALGRVGVRVEAEAVDVDSAVVELYSWIAQGVVITPQLGLWLARRNTEMRFGTLSVDGEDAVILGHALFEESVEGVVLPRTVEVLARTADALDVELRAAFPATG